jgi:branched-chain amino acid transport system ATP-binding protein
LAADAELVISGLHAGYRDSQVLHGVDIVVAPGAITTIIGPNGAGKSTLLKAIFGLATVTRGSIRLGELELRGKRGGELLKAGLAFVPQGRCNFPRMNVQENLEMAAFTLDRKTARRAIAETYERVPFLAGRRRHLAGTLSGGEQQVLEMAMAQVVSPTVLLLDEPSLGLAPRMLTTVLDEVQAVSSRGVTVLMVEQNARQALERSEHGVVLDLGRKVLEGSGPELLSNPRLGELYLGGRASEIKVAPRGREDFECETARGAVDPSGED